MTVQKGQAPANADESVPPNGENEEPANAPDKETAVEINARLLEESKRNKQRARDAEARLKAIEESQLTEQQRYKELYENTKSKLESTQKKATELQLKTQLMPKLSAAGCVDVTDAMKLGNAALLVHDEEENSLSGVDEYISDLQKRKPYLFKSGKPSSVNDSLPPGGKVPIGNGKEDYSKLTKEQIKDRLRQLS